MLTIDIQAFRTINGLSGHPVPDRVFYAITTLGIPAWIALAVVLFFGAGVLPGLRGPKSARWRAIGLVLGAAEAAAGLLELLIKDVVRRPRPSEVLSGVHVIGSVPHSFSFPSGHTLTAFAAAYVLMSAIRSESGRGGFRASIAGGWAGVGFAAAIGFSRMYVGVHYPLDVLTGAVLGWLLGSGSWRLFRWFVRRKGGTH